MTIGSWEALTGCDPPPTVTESGSRDVPATIGRPGVCGDIARPETAAESASGSVEQHCVVVATTRFGGRSVVSDGPRMSSKLMWVTLA